MADRRLAAESDARSVALGVTDLMTSLAVIFVLLLVVFVGASRPAASRVDPRAPVGVADVRAALGRSSPDGVGLEQDPRDPHVLRVLIPEALLTFEFARSTLAPAGERFLARVMPAYATVLCGDLADRVAGIVIEGHTDDLGDDALNFRLSQDRSFRVLVRGLDAIRVSAPEAHDCFAALASASGRGKHDLVYDGARRPDRALSRRVVLKILLREPPERS
ncbi:MAG: hypothetical protein HY294_08065 [Candidatus Rokubacteria bacterium]|nr:hypothetical protein [Candidatus Rokubacteria bacterium]